MSDPSVLSVQSSFKLPPIGFEQYNYADQEVKPLKKKKRKRSKVLQNIQLAASGFRDSGEGEPQLVDYRFPPDTNSARPLKPRTSNYNKRFTISDLEPNISLQQMTGKMMSKDVAAILRELYSKEELARTDFVLVYHQALSNDEESPDEKKKEALRKQKRLRFQKMLEEDGFDIGEVQIDEKTVFVKLQCTFRRLCREAEKIKLQMPLKDMEVKESAPDCCGGCEDCIDKCFVTDNEADFVSAPFQQSKLHLFENCGKPDIFFRSALRGLLIHHILKNIDLRDLPKTANYYYHHDDDDDPDEDVLAKQGLPFLILKKVYVDAFTLHDESIDQNKEAESNQNIETAMSNQPSSQPERSVDVLDENTALQKIIKVYGDARHMMNITWPKVCKFQPLWKVRNYFGEEIALYFAWIGLLVFTLVIPMLMGLGVFGYGLFKSVVIAESQNRTLGVSASDPSRLVEEALLLLDIIKVAFDNEATPFYAIAVCLWCTIFLEMWKRKNAVLAYEWDVENFEDVEPDRPEYYGTKEDRDPITGEKVKLYPFHYRCMKYTISFITFLFMVAIVVCIMLSVVLYRLILNIDYCTPSVTNGTVTAASELSAPSCFMITTVCSSVLNAIAIMILGKVYDRLARALTRWENHRTDSAFRNALIVKLFAFQFANNYSSLYYIAFFRDTKLQTALFSGTGLLGLGAKYQDSCGDGSYGKTCMSQLSFQVLALMIIKPFPKFLMDVILPWLIRIFKRCCTKKSAVDPENNNPEPDPETFFLQQERNKPQLNDFTLGEYTEKVIQYGFLTLFAAAMPLGPVIVIVVNILDRYVDSKRLLWQYRRPVANIAQDIGMWFPILEFINIAAVITNGFLIAYVSSWGQLYKSLWPNGYVAQHELWTVLVFEHLVFGLKYLFAIAIPDIPQRVRLAMRKEKYSVAKILDIGKFTKDLTEDLSLEPATRKSKHIDTAKSLEFQSTKQFQLRRRTPSVTEKDPDNGSISPRTNKYGSVALEYGPDGTSYIRT